MLNCSFLIDSKLGLVKYFILFSKAGVSKYSGGEIKYYPGYHLADHPEQAVRFCVDFKRYLTRKIGFEAVMRIRCTRGDYIIYILNLSNYLILILYIIIKL